MPRDPHVRSSLSRLPFVWALGLSLLIVPSFAMGETQNDLIAVRARIDAAWSGFDSIACRSVEHYADPFHDKVDTLKTVVFSWKMDGRVAWSSTTQQANITRYFDVREDGAKRTTVNYYLTPPKAIDQINIGPPRGESGRVGELTFAGLWMFLPGGRTVADLLNHGGTLANAGITGWPRWTLTLAAERSRVECVLDEAHQFLPSELTIRTDTSQRTIRVDRFERANGFWYPAAGSSVTTGSTLPSGPVVVAWQLDQVAINQPIPDAMFAWTDLPPGVQVFNRIDNTSRIVGGKLAQIKRTRAHPATKSTPPHQEAVEVSSDPGSDVRSMLSYGLLGVAILAGGVGVFLRWRGL